MSDRKTGPFDAVISCLRLEEEFLHRTNYEGRYMPAIRVLEAAAKVDKKDCLLWLNRAKSWFVKEGKTTMDIPYPLDQIRALLNALPDEEER
jgi:hypothetical protein